jgi:hypothetical protein
MTESDVEADVPMSEIFKDKRQYEQYKRVGFHERGEAFLRMIEKWEKDQELDEGDRDMREDVRTVYVTRMGIVKACDKLLTKDVLKGVGDAQHGINRLVGELGEQRTLDLIKPRLINLVGDENGTESLTELWQALRDMHGVYRSAGFNKVYSRIERYRAQYGITPAKWVEIQSGGNWHEIAGRAYGEFQKQHGFFGKMWHQIPHLWHAAKIGFAGWREERNGAMERLRETRSRALDVLSLVLGEDFQKLIDKEIKSGNPAETERALKDQQRQQSEMANGLTEAELTQYRDAQWENYARNNPTENNTAGYDNWLENDFTPTYRDNVRAQSGDGWFARMVQTLFSIRLENIPRPAGI